ncbi:Zinc finger BED domain-containing protein RICESLEEPER 2 [Bienertia sinuspersici]
MTHWITMHEHLFTIVEEGGFNLMMKHGLPQWTSVSRHTIRFDSFIVTEFKKRTSDRVINFVHLPPPLKGANITDCILTCLHDWEIDDKTNDIFHCCAHILNIMVQHGLDQVTHIISKVHATVDCLNRSEARLKRFGELVSQYNVFPRCASHDSYYEFCPDGDE